MPSEVEIGSEASATTTDSPTETPSVISTCVVPTASPAEAGKETLWFPSAATVPEPARVPLTAPLVTAPTMSWEVAVGRVTIKAPPEASARARAHTDPLGPSRYAECMARVGWFLIDLACVTAFAAVGRASHGESVLGTFTTAWPFLVACTVAWATLLMLRDPGIGVRASLIVWLATLAGGMALRMAGGDTAAPAFVMVATLFLALTLPGWRLVRHLVAARTTAPDRRRPSTPARRV